MIIRFEELETVRQRHAAQVLVMGGGTFDLVHPGHVGYMKHLRESGDVVLVSISNDQWYSDYAHKIGKALTQPVNPQADRAEVIDAIRYVDYVLLDPHWPEEPYRHPTLRICERLRPDLHVTSHPEQRSFAEELMGYGTRLTILSRQSEHATSDIIRRAKEEPAFPA